jgi:hypothetical protein
MNIAAKTEPVKGDSAFDAYFDLEEPIRDVAYMAGVAETLAIDLLAEDAGFEGEVTIQLNRKQFDQLMFAISKASDMAADLNRIYLAKWEAAKG